MTKFIEGGPETLKCLKKFISTNQENEVSIGKDLPLTHLSEVEVLAPIPRPRRNVFCVGKNYKDHILEIAAAAASKNPDEPAPPLELPKYAQFFTKAPECVIPTGGSILSHKNITRWLDYEAEMAVVIGKQGRDISAEDAMEHVFGFTIGNDVTARDVQKKHVQFFKGKTLDTTCPMGPFIALADTIDCSNLSVKLWINEELRQNSTTKNMIFDVPEIIRQLSAGFTLYPGDVILTGTPDGVGYAMKPPKTLKAGDRIKIEIEHLGTLENTVVDE